MSRAILVNGPTMVYVKGSVATPIAAITELGLSQDPIRIIENYVHDDVKVDAWGRVPPDIQYFGSTANISMSLVNIDLTVLALCKMISQGSSAADGTLQQAGYLLGGQTTRFQQGWSYISLNLSSPAAGVPYRFYNCYLTGPPVEVSVGSERSIYNLNWRAIPYTPDPYQAGAGLRGQILYDHILDS